MINDKTESILKVFERSWKFGTFLYWNEFLVNLIIEFYHFQKKNSNVLRRKWTSTNLEWNMRVCYKKSRVYSCSVWGSRWRYVRRAKFHWSGGISGNYLFHAYAKNLRFDYFVNIDFLKEQGTNSQISQIFFENNCGRLNQTDDFSKFSAIFFLLIHFFISWDLNNPFSVCSNRNHVWVIRFDYLEYWQYESTPTNGM